MRCTAIRSPRSRTTRGRAEQLPPRRAAVRRRPLRRSVVEHEKDGVRLSQHDKSGEAGYGALLVIAAQPRGPCPPSSRRCSAPASRARCASRRTSPATPARARPHRRGREALRAEESDQAAALAQRVVELSRRRPTPHVASPGRCSRIRVRQEQLAVAEKASAEALKLTPEKDPARADLVERQQPRSTSRPSSRAPAARTRSGGELRPRRHGRAGSTVPPTRSTTPPRR